LPGRSPEETVAPAARPSGAAPEAAAGSGPRYHAVRLHARGGLGEVHLAEDNELRRPVALKRIRDSHAHNPELRHRFIREAEITARLEHPGIVPVYGLVQGDDGQPCYAMRFIEGESLRAAIERFHRADAGGKGGGRAVEFRRLLGRFLGVCNTVAYAHSKGVIHRDLKPDNIMLGRYGETLVVDWGLAKHLGDEEGPATGTGGPAAGSATATALYPSTLTETGQVVGTLAYMSPEQAEGRPGAAGPAGDVYSLGATLYCLLTGRPPVTGGDTVSALHQVRCGAFPRPRQLVPAVDPALEAVCLKAVARDPNERYASPRLLADDLEHWLADEPVTARAEPWAAKARRWVGRHRLGVTGSAAALVAVTVSLAVATVLLAAANNEARRQQQIAERSDRLARRAVDRYHTEVSESVLLHEPGLEPLRRQLLQAAREFYAEFARQRADDPTARGELGKALFRLAQITGDIGSERQAIDLYRRALEVLTRAGPGYDADRAACLHHLGRLYRLTDRLDRAEASYLQALKIWDRLVRASPHEDLYRAGQARSQLGLGNVHQVRRRLDRSRDLYAQALRTRKALADAHPDVPEYRHDLAVSQNNLAMVFSAAGRTRRAESAFLQAVETLRALVHDYPHVSQYQNDLAHGHYNLASLYARTGQTARAVARLREATALWQELADKHPARTAFRTKLAEAYEALAAAYRTSRQTGPALDAAQKAVAIQKKLAREHRGVASYQGDLARAYFHLGGAYRTAGRADRAEAALQDALRLQEKLAARWPAVPGYQSDLARTYDALGHLYRGARELDKAERAFARAVARWRKLARVHAAEPEYQAGLCTSRCNRGDVARTGGRPEEALAWYARALAPPEKSGLGPLPPALRQARRDAHWKRAEVLTDLGRWDDALADWDRAVELTLVPAEKPWFRLYRTRTLAHAGRHAAAAGEVEGLVGPARGSGEFLYQLARVLALAAGVAAKDEALPPADRQQAADRYGARAVELLDLARAAGYFRAAANRKKLARDARFEPLRRRDDFQKLLGEQGE
jgi:serine/threonine-protein kinase